MQVKLVMATTRLGIFCWSTAIRRKIKVCCVSSQCAASKNRFQFQILSPLLRCQTSKKKEKFAFPDRQKPKPEELPIQITCDKVRSETFMSLIGDTEKQGANFDIFERSRRLRGDRVEKERVPVWRLAFWKAKSRQTGVALESWLRPTLRPRRQCTKASLLHTKCHFLETIFLPSPFAIFSSSVASLQQQSVHIPPNHILLRSGTISSSARSACRAHPTTDTLPSSRQMEGFTRSNMPSRLSTPPVSPALLFAARTVP